VADTGALLNKWMIETKSGKPLVSESGNLLRFPTAAMAVAYSIAGDRISALSKYSPPTAAKYIVP
jgi:hypothetical protein